MNRRTVKICAVSTLLIGLTAVTKADDDRNDGLSVTVSFGAGLNTVGASNHHILPAVIKVREGGVVNFVVAGFHQIFVYNPGTTPDDIRAFIASITPPPPAQPPLFINDLNNLKYMGINPEGRNDAIPPVNPAFADRRNRVESVSFSEPGMYLIICNVGPHFLNGMFAWVKVVGDNDDKDNDEHHHHEQ
jgi:plastocyanin